MDPGLHLLPLLLLPLLLGPQPLHPMAQPQPLPLLSWGGWCAIRSMGGPRIS
jgi:hypothetical protein